MDAVLLVNRTTPRETHPLPGIPEVVGGLQFSREKVMFAEGCERSGGEERLSRVSSEVTGAATEGLVAGWERRSFYGAHEGLVMFFLELFCAVAHMYPMTIEHD